MAEENKAESFPFKERKLLHEQLELLAEQSKKCSPHELAELSEQMFNIYSILKP